MLKQDLTPTSATQRIAIFYPFLSDGSGIQRVISVLASEMVNYGWKIDLIERKKGSYTWEIPSEIQLINFETDNPYIMLSALVKYLRQKRPLNLLSTHIYGNLISIVARKIAGIPCNIIISQHNNLSYLVKNDSRLIVKLMPYLVKILYPQADQIVAVSQGVADDLASILNVSINQIHTIYNPVVTPRLFTLAQKVPAHPWLLSQEIPVILGAGRLNKQKDFSTLIRAFAKVRAQRECRLIIIGEGKERSQLESLVEQLELTECISMPGFIENPYSYMARASLFVLSSCWEGFGNVLVEAMALGTAVVSTECPSGPAEILERGKYGLLVPVGDVVALAQAIENNIDNPSNSEQLKARAMDFTVELAIEKYLKLIENDVSKC